MGKRHLVVDDEVYDMVTSSCVREFYSQNPKMVGMRITHNFIVRRIAEFYLEE